MKVEHKLFLLRYNTSEAERVSVSSWSWLFQPWLPCCVFSFLHIVWSRLRSFFFADETVSLSAHLSIVLMWLSDLWAASVAFPPCSPLSTRTKIRYEVQHIPSLPVAWVAASSLPSCPCEQIQTMFWCCLLCCGETTRLIKLTCQKKRAAPHGEQVECFLQRWSKGISSWA